MSRTLICAVALLMATGATSAGADETVYDDALGPDWDSWSWSGSYDFEHAGLVYAGSLAIEANTEAWGALSLHRSGDFAGYEGLQFWMEGDAGDVLLNLEADDEGYASPAVAISDLATVSSGSWTQVLWPIDTLGAHDWTRINWMDSTGFGSAFRLDDIELLDTIVVPDAFTAVLPIGQRTLMLLGHGDAGAVTVTLAGNPIAVVTDEEFDDPQRTLLTLDADLWEGALVVETADGTFSRSLVNQVTSYDEAPTHDISPLIYGMAFPPDAAYVWEHGVTVARWGGNATTLYNPNGHYTNAGNDWYFENRDADDADGWMGSQQAAGADTFLSVPALDWVAADNSSYSYSVALYGPQQDADPWNPDAGNGITTGGTAITWNDPADACVPWDEEDARAWLAGLANPPRFASVANELDIASSTHQDVHPDPMTYDEQLERFLTYAAVIHDALPGAEVAGLSSCCWWYYWNSAAGDKPEHGNEDFLAWFLDEVAAADAEAGSRSLDVFDIHYYPDAVFNDDTSDATRALRLRSTRSLWDPSYTDEGWIGTDQWATVNQPSPNEVQLIPRFQQLIDDRYPGTKLGITEWNFGAEADLSGGLAVADVLGIYGREDLYLATHWTTPDAGTPAAAAFQLFRGEEPYFGEHALAVTVGGYDPDLLGVYAAADDDDRLTWVVVNKDLDHDQVIAVDGPPGLVGVMRVFGDALGGQVVTAPFDGTAIVVPAYGAVFVAAEVTMPGDDDDDDDDTADDDDDDVADDDDDDDDGDDDDGHSGDDDENAGDDCSCGVAGEGSPAAMILALLMSLTVLRRRYRSQR